MKDNEIYLNPHHLYLVDHFYNLLNDSYTSAYGQNENLGSYPQKLFYYDNNLDIIVDKLLIAFNSKPQDYNINVEKLYYPALNDVLESDISHTLKYKTEFLQDRLIFLALAQVAKKTNFLPLSYHEIYEEFLRDKYDEKTHNDILNMRRQVILHGMPLLSVLVLEMLTAMTMKNNLGYATLGHEKGHLQLRTDLQKLLENLFAHLVQLRRKATETDVFLYRKDLDLVSHLAFMLNVDVDYRLFYLYAKFMGM